MTDSEIFLERIELVSQEILKELKFVSVLLSDLLMVMTPRGKAPAVKEDTKKIWLCAWCGLTGEKANDDRICIKCEEKEQSEAPL